MFVFTASLRARSMGGIRLARSPIYACTECTRTIYTTFFLPLPLDDAFAKVRAQLMTEDDVNNMGDLLLKENLLWSIKVVIPYDPLDNAFTKVESQLMLVSVSMHWKSSLQLNTCFWFTQAAIPYVKLLGPATAEQQPAVHLLTIEVYLSSIF